MKWTVTYRPAAQDHLASIWLKAQDQQAVADAADEIDRLLSIDLLNAGESRAEISVSSSSDRCPCFMTSTTTTRASKSSQFHFGDIASNSARELERFQGWCSD